MTNQMKQSLSDSPVLRWTVLLLTSLSLATNYYFYDALSPLKDLLSKDLGFSNADYGFFNSAYSIPNVFLFMAIIGGIILDKIGIRITGFMFITFMVAGGALTAYGATEYYNAGGIGYHFMNSFFKDYSPALKMMSLGYFLFGLGAETSNVVISKAIVKWFQGKELALALGLNVATARLGTAMALIFSPRLIYPHWTNAIWVGVLLLAIGLLAFMVYNVLDLRFDRFSKSQQDAEEPEEEFHISDVTKLLKTPAFIYITLLCVTFYSAVFPFMKYAPDMMINKFGVSRELAGTIVSILPFGTILFTPFFGWYADTRGKSASLMILGAVLLISVHLMFALTEINPYIPMFILGVAFSLVPAAMWPSVAKIVEQRRIGSAYGLMFSIQNIGLWAFPMLIGIVLDNSNSNASKSFNPQESQQILAQKSAQAIYLNDAGEALAGQKIKINLMVNDKDGNTIWDEYQLVNTDNSGQYTAEIGKMEEISFVDYNYLQKNDSLLVRLSYSDKGQEIVFFASELKNLAENMQFFLQDAQKNIIKDKQQTILFSLWNETENMPVWKESFDIYADKNGSFEFIPGKGVLEFAKVAYFDLQKPENVVVVNVPLNYRNAVLMLAFLGVWGVLFAFLLRNTDKTSGFGLELPNRKD